MIKKKKKNRKKNENFTNPTLFCLPSLLLLFIFFISSWKSGISTCYIQFLVSSDSSSSITTCNLSTVICFIFYFCTLFTGTGKAGRGHNSELINNNIAFCPFVILFLTFPFHLSFSADLTQAVYLIPRHSPWLRYLTYQNSIAFICI